MTEKKQTTAGNKGAAEKAATKPVRKKTAATGKTRKTAAKPAGRKKTPAKTKTAATRKKKTPAKQAVPEKAVVEPPQAKVPSLILVGIGASAGGLEALKEMISSLPKTGVLSYVVAQHLSPKHNSVLMELLTPATEMRVTDLSGNHPAEPDTIYVTPPNHDVEYRDGLLHLTKPHQEVGPKPSVDHFFTSLAETVGENAVGIILSGTGSDGAIGVKAIKAAGGMAIAQDPETAKYDGMPRAAIRTDCVDLVMAPESMGKALNSLASGTVEIPAALDSLDDQELYNRIVTLVKRGSGFDLAHYKSGTVNRRITRRMGLHGITSLLDYVDLLEQDNDEAEQLARNILISVTSFMRDPIPFKALDRRLMELVKKRTPNDVIRCWIAGCATGEEAYSIAMLLAENLHKQGESDDSFLIFATDIDNNALEFARNGIYSKGAVDALPPGLRKRYLDEHGDQYQVTKSLRKNIVFASQNVVEDPPFSRLDLVACRNLLIYLNRDVQRRVMETFHFSLKPGGFMFLGKSETIEPHRDLFSVVDKSERIFVASENVQILPRPVSKGSRASTVLPRDNRAKIRETAEVDELGIMLRDQLIDSHCPPSVVIDSRDHIQHFVGDVKEYLDFPRGDADLVLFDLVEESVRAEMRALVHRARRQQLPQTSPVLRSGHESLPPLKLKIEPLKRDDQGRLLVSFMSVEGLPETIEYKSGEGQYNLILGELERELAATRQHLQTVIEELETSNEELQSQSEELQSANEELQSTNEELQTSNEELQSTNEELMTVNDEAQYKAEQLEKLASDLRNVRESINSPLMVIDAELRITQYNKAVGQIMALDKVEPMSFIASAQWRFDYFKLVPLVRETLSGKTTKNNLLVETTAGTSYVVNAQPYKTGKAGITGVILVFADITTLKRTEEDLHEQKELMRVSLEGIGDGVITVTLDGTISYINPSAERICDIKSRDYLRRPLSACLRTQNDGKRPTLAQYIDAVMSAGSDKIDKAPKDFVLITERGRKSPIQAMATPIVTQFGQVTGAVLLIRDVTEERLLAEELTYRATHDALTGLLNRDEFNRQLKETFNRIRHDPAEHALLFMDLDRFKIINDTSGHAAGDELLRQVALQLRSRMRTSDTLARLGGDEFAMLLRGCPMARAEEIAGELVARLHDYKFTWQEREFTIGVSIGIVPINVNSESVANVLTHADAACYAAKNAGRGRYHVVKDPATEIADHYLEVNVVSEISSAVDKNRFVLHVQDIVPLTDMKAQDKPLYRELLIRMKDKDGELMLPDAFIPAAERYFMISTIDQWVLRNAFEYIASRDDGFVYGINLSGQSLGDRDFHALVVNLLEASKADPERICFEITETAAISHLSEALGFIRKMSDFGCKFALDDFGAGMSSLGYIKNLPVQYLKIDGSFVQGINESPVDRTLVEAVVRIADELDLVTIAEHVEDQKTADALNELGVGYIQGWLIGKAKPLD